MNQADLRLVLLRPAKEDDEPTQHVVAEPGIAADSGARVLTVRESNTAVYFPSPQPRVEVIDEMGTTVSSTLLPKPPSSAAVVSQAGNLMTWWTGDSVMVFDASSLTLALHHRRRRDDGAVGTRCDDGGQAARAGHRRDRCL